MACMTCVECGESFNALECPHCGSALTVSDESFNEVELEEENENPGDE